jgi:hypothetical protein
MTYDFVVIRRDTHKKVSKTAHPCQHCNCKMNRSTLLHHWHASGLFNGSVDIALFLMEHGVDATAQDKRGSTPMNQASRCGNMYLARLLAEHATDRTVKAAPQIQHPATT